MIRSHARNRRPLVQPLESRSMLSIDGFTKLVDENGWALATQGLTRDGEFVLPKVGNDGSVSLVGSSEADLITVEQVVGVHEAARLANGGPADGEMDFVLLLNDSGEYTRFDLIADAKGIADHKRLHEVRLSSTPEIVEQWRNDPSAQGQINYGTSSESLARELRDDSLYQNLADKYANTTFVHYTLAGVYDFYVEVSPNASARTKINIEAGSGSDTIQVASNVPMRTNLFGGSGADKITSGKRVANLFGGGGNDLLVSRSSQGGSIDGGKGTDRLLSRAANVVVTNRADGDQFLNGATPVKLNWTTKPTSDPETFDLVITTDAGTHTRQVKRGQQITFADLLA